MLSSGMDKFLLLLLGVSIIMFFQGVAPSTLCMVCKVFKNGECLEGMGNCTVEKGPGCRATDIFFFNYKGVWLFNHTVLDCSNECKAWRLFQENRKILSFCCQGEDFCNQYRGLAQLKKYQ